MADIRNRVKEYRLVRAGDILPNPRNWRTHPQAQKDAYRAIAESIGFAGALLTRELDDGRLMLIDGHMRQSENPDELLPVLITDLSESESDTVLATFDPISAMAQADAAALDSLLRTVNSDSAAVQAMLAQLADDAGLYQDAHPNAGEDQGAQIDRADELREKWQTERGQLWVIPSKTGKGEHRLLCGDSTNADDVGRVMAGERADITHADPPYGIDLLSKRGNVGKSQAYDPVIGDDQPFDPVPFLSYAKDTILERGFLARDIGRQASCQAFLYHPTLSALDR